MNNWITLREKLIDFYWNYSSQMNSERFLNILLNLWCDVEERRAEEETLYKWNWKSHHNISFTLNWWEQTVSSYRSNFLASNMEQMCVCVCMRLYVAPLFSPWCAFRFNVQTFSERTHTIHLTTAIENVLNFSITIYSQKMIHWICVGPFFSLFPFTSCDIRGASIHTISLMKNGNINFYLIFAFSD